MITADGLPTSNPSGMTILDRAYVWEGPASFLVIVGPLPTAVPQSPTHPGPESEAR